jgi:hypothetical protein
VSVKKPTIPRAFQVLRKAEEMAICRTCPLAECVGAESRECPARRIDRIIRSRVRRARERQQRADRKAGRGYWPDIHGTEGN